MVAAQNGKAQAAGRGPVSTAHPEMCSPNRSTLLFTAVLMCMRDEGRSAVSERVDVI